MSTENPGFNYPEAAAEERRADRHGTFPQYDPPRSKPDHTDYPSITDRGPEAADPNLGSEVEVVGYEPDPKNPFALDPETIALGKEQVDKLRRQLAAQRSNPPTGENTD